MSERPPMDVRIFYADTKFERKARAPGGVSREQALQNAQEAVGSLEPEFSVWIGREVDRLIADMAEVALDPSKPVALERAKMSCAQLRDVGDTMGYHLVTYIAKMFFSIIEAVIAGAVYDQSVADCHLAALKLALSDEYRNCHPQDLPEMTMGLARISELTTIVPGVPN